MVPPVSSPVDESAIHEGCVKCGISFKPPRAHHCRVCGRCIVKMDHHCPWINNCVAIRNQKHFILLSFYIGLYSLFCLIITVIRLCNCSDSYPCAEKPRGICYIIIYYRFNVYCNCWSNFSVLYRIYGKCGYCTDDRYNDGI